MPSPRLVSDLRTLAYSMNDEEQSVRIPFPSASNPPGVTNVTFAELFQNIKNDALPGLPELARRGRLRFLDDERTEIGPGDIDADLEAPAVGGGGGAGGVGAMDQAPVPGAPGDNYNTLTEDQKRLKRLQSQKEKCFLWQKVFWCSDIYRCLYLIIPSFGKVFLCIALFNGTFNTNNFRFFLIQIHNFYMSLKNLFLI
jgi:hypothetical protein